MRTFSLAFFLFLLGLCVAHALHYYPLLPEKVASHFGASGQPDSWMDKTSFVTIYLAVTGMIGILFLLIGIGISYIPAPFINLPHKEYWLSAERKKNTLSKLSEYFFWFGSASLLLMLDIFHQAFQVHLGMAGKLEHPLLSLVIYLLFSAGWCLKLIRTFAAIPER